MANLNWSTETDWNQSRDNSGVVHEAISNTDNSDATKIKKGYSYQQPPLTNDLVGWWPLHDKVANDLSGNDNHGTLNGGVTTQVSGVGGIKAMSFDGASNTEVNLPNSTEYQFSSSDNFSISFWVYPKSSGYSHFISYGNSGGSRFDYEGWRFRLQSDNSVQFLLTDTSDNNCLFSSALTLDNWYHITIVYNGSSGGDMVLYVNAEIETSGTNPSQSIDYSSLDASIGNRSDGGQPYNGHISDVRIYDRALTSSEIQTLYEWGKSSNMLLGSVVRA